MKELELTVLKRDMDAVLEFLGRGASLQLIGNENSPSQPGSNPDETALIGIKKKLEKIEAAASWLGIALPSEPLESSRFPGEAEEALALAIDAAVLPLRERESEVLAEKDELARALYEARAFSNLNAPFSDLEQLSYLSFRIGRLDPARHGELRRNLSDRAVIIALGEGDGILAASSRKGRFALDTELEKLNFLPMTVPEGHKGVPSDLLSGIEKRFDEINTEVDDIKSRKEKLKAQHEENVRMLEASYLMAEIAERTKLRLTATPSAYLLSGWVPEDTLGSLAAGLEKVSGGRAAIRAYNAGELAAVKTGKEKIPVSLKHGAFVRGFESLVLSYGAPLYGAIDPTPLVAVFFTLLFGIMFGDLGQGFVLFLLGILTGKLAFFSAFRKFSVPLMAAGAASMLMGFLTGEVFTNEELLIVPTRLLTGFLTGNPIDRILTIMPLSEKGGSVTKLIFFFGFTLAAGVVLNSSGLIINVINKFSQRKYEKALFEKTGLAGIFFFWYAVFIALRFILSLLGKTKAFAFCWFDAAALLVPVIVIFLAPALWRLASGERPVFIEGITVYIVEGFVEILETVSTYISNTVSFLRVGAFALSHAVLAYIVFRFSAEVSAGISTAGIFLSLFILVFGNLVIILLEGMIVAIQVVRLQYYEFFGKFFTETGVEFSPFRFGKERS